jgi:hypothetical protein
MKKSSMKNTRKEECERSCERTSQKPDSPAPVQVSDHQRRFGDTALPRSAAWRTRERQGKETAAQKASQFLESRMNRSRTPVYRTSLVYIEGPSLSQIRSTQIPETAPGTSLRLTHHSCFVVIIGRIALKCLSLSFSTASSLSFCTLIC